MNPVLVEILKSGYTKAPNGQLVKLHSAIDADEGEFLQELISELKPVVSLEVGLAYGISALFICDALKKIPNSRHIIIDPNQYGGRWGDSWEGIGLHNLREAGYEEMIEFHNMPSHRALPKIEAQERKIDFAFIDGWHTFDYAMIDFFYIDRLLRVGGIVAIDDANWKGIRKLCRYIATNRSYSIRSLSATRPSLLKKRRFLHGLLNGGLRIPHISEVLRHTVKAEILESDIEIGLWGTVIAFKKEAEDERRWDFHHHF